MPNEKQLLDRELKLKERLDKLSQLEREIKEREKSLKQKESSRKQVILRISPSLWAELSSWAEEDFRSVNGQIEFILTEAVRKRKKRFEK